MKNQTSTEKGLKHLCFIGVGRDYAERRISEMQTKDKSSKNTLSETNGKKSEK